MKLCSSNTVFRAVSKSAFEIFTARLVFTPSASKVLYKYNYANINFQAMLIVLPLLHQKLLSISREKLPSVRFSFVLCFRIMPIDAPAIICHHIDVPPTLIPSFHYTDILMKAFSLFFTVGA